MLKIPDYCTENQHKEKENQGTHMKPCHTPLLLRAILHGFSLESLPALLPGGWDFLQTPGALAFPWKGLLASDHLSCALRLQSNFLNMSASQNLQMLPYPAKRNFADITKDLETERFSGVIWVALSVITNVLRGRFYFRRGGGDVMTEAEGGVIYCEGGRRDHKSRNLLFKEIL